MLSATLQQHAEAIAAQYLPPETGRPSVLNNAETLTELLEQLANGASREAACQVAGLSIRTLQRIETRAEAGAEPESAFVALIKRAEGLVEARVTKNILRASELPQFWTAGGWYLERKYPHRYGKRDGDGDSPRVVVQIGVQSADVQVNVISNYQTQSQSEGQPPQALTAALDVPFASESAERNTSTLAKVQGGGLRYPELAGSGGGNSAPSADSGARSPQGTHPVPGRVQARTKRSQEKRRGAAGKKKGVGA